MTNARTRTPSYLGADAIDSRRKVAISDCSVAGLWWCEERVRVRIDVRERGFAKHRQVK